MDTGSPAVPCSAAATEDTAVLTVVDEIENDEGFKNIYDVPFIIINQIGDILEAEIQADSDIIVTLGRMREAQNEALSKGFIVAGERLGDKVYKELAGLDHGIIGLKFTRDGRL